MNRSETTGKLFAALAKAQGKMRAAEKDAQNSHLKNKYATLDSVIEAIRAPLAEVGLAFVQDIQSAERSVTVTTFLALGDTEEWISTAVSMPVAQATAHGIASAVTYGRRYTLMALCGIAPGEAEDDDGEAAVRGTQATQQNRTQQPQQRPYTPPPQQARATHATRRKPCPVRHPWRY